VRRFALAVTLGSLALLAIPFAAMAAHRADDGTMRGAARSTGVVRWPGGTNARLFFLNEAVAPDTYSIAPKGGVRRADHAGAGEQVGSPASSIP
jgi:hypothetical protein